VPPSSEKSIKSQPPTAGIMLLRPTQGETPSVRQLLSMDAPLSPLSSRAQPRDLQFYGPFLEMFSTERSAVDLLSPLNHRAGGKYSDRIRIASEITASTDRSQLLSVRCILVPRG
jgi:hypothetical protein